MEFLTCSINIYFFLLSNMRCFLGIACAVTLERFLNSRVLSPYWIVQFICTSSVLSFKWILILAVHNQLLSFIILLGAYSVHQKTCLGWMMNERSEKVIIFNGMLAWKKKKKASWCWKIFFFLMFLLVIGEHHGTVILAETTLFSTYFHVDVASSINNNRNKISHRSHFR